MNNLEKNIVPTENSTGNIYLMPTPMGKSFLSDVCKKGAKVLEVGAGYGFLPIDALNKDIAEYIANDISSIHLQKLSKLVKRYTPEKQNKFKSICCPASKMPEFKFKLDGVILEKIIHFLTPKEIEIFFLWLKRNISNNGMLYISAASISSPYFLPIQGELISKKIEGQPFSCYIENLKTKLSADECPDSLTLFDTKLLTELMAKHGFAVKESYYMTFCEKNSCWVTSSEANDNSLAVVCARNNSY